MEIYPPRRVDKVYQTHLSRLKKCKEIAQNSPCLSRKVGAILVYKDCIVSEGFNRTPCNTDACKNCIRKSKKSGEALDICKAIHAEEVCILNFLKTHSFDELQDCTLYITTSPCYNCAKLIVECKIKAVIASEDYNSNYSNAILTEAKIPLVIFNE